MNQDPFLATFVRDRQQEIASVVADWRGPAEHH